MLNKSVSVKLILFFAIFYSVFIQIFLNDILIYQVLKNILYILLLFLLLIIIIRKKIRIDNFLKYYFYSIVSFITLYLAGSIIFINEISFTALYSLFPLLIILIISNNIVLENSELTIIYKYFPLITLIVGNFIIFTQGTGYYIADQYLFSSKNQLGPIIAISTIFAFYNLVSNRVDYMKNNVFNFYIKVLFILGNLIPIIVIRNRASLIALLIIFIIMLAKEFKISNKFFVMLLFSSFPIFIFQNQIIELFLMAKDSFILNRDVSSINSLSANRWESYIQTLDFLKSNLLFGEMNNPSLIFDPHNFILYRLYKYGLIISLPLLLFYFYLFFIIFRNLTSKFHRKNGVSIYLLFFAIIVSLFEYSPPIGPGTTYLIVWFLLVQENSRKKQVSI